jgi:hypothetical protein
MRHEYLHKVGAFGNIRAMCLEVAALGGWALHGDVKTSSAVVVTFQSIGSV